MKGKGNVVSRSRTTEVTSGERPGPFMKRDVKGSVTGPTSVSMSLPVLISLHSLILYII